MYYISAYTKHYLRPSQETYSHCFGENYYNNQIVHSFTEPSAASLGTRYFKGGAQYRALYRMRLTNTVTSPLVLMETIRSL